MTSSSPSRFLGKESHQFVSENKYIINCGSFDIESFHDDEEEDEEEERIRFKRAGGGDVAHVAFLSCFLGNRIKKKQVDGWNVDSST